QLDAEPSARRARTAVAAHRGRAEHDACRHLAVPPQRAQEPFAVATALVREEPVVPSRRVGQHEGLLGVLAVMAASLHHLWFCFQLLDRVRSCVPSDSSASATTAAIPPRAGSPPARCSTTRSTSPSAPTNSA